MYYARVSHHNASFTCVFVGRGVIGWAGSAIQRPARSAAN